MKHVRSLLVVTLIGLLLAGATEIWRRSQIGLDRRVVNTTLTMPTQPIGISNWRLRPVFTGMKRRKVTAMKRGPDGRVYLLEKDGRIALLPQDPDDDQAKVTVWLNIKSQVASGGEGGLLGLAFHPQYGRSDSPNNRYVYVYYSAQVGGRRTNRLSRFEANASGAKLLAKSELILIDQEDEHYWHDGGGMAFGPDGFLYLGLGDEGNSEDSFHNSQTISKDLFSGVIRIDVDRHGGSISHPAPRQPRTGTTNHYFIPNDNPFVGKSGVLEEFWAIGIRNPHNLSFDSTTGALLVTDVGQSSREEINLVVKGGNHQWAYLEGNLPVQEGPFFGKKPDSLIGTEQPPLFAYAHQYGNNCVIGGLVYRGSRHPELYGKYLYGDLGSGRLWALSLNFEDESKQLKHEFIAQVEGKDARSLVAICTDGEDRIYVATLAGSVMMLERRQDSDIAATLPAKLSETGVFADLATLTTNPGFVPYEVNSPLWSDGAIKRRWISIPGNGSSENPIVDRIIFANDDPCSFPAGTCFVKHFELPVDELVPSRVKRLETRIIMRDDNGGIYGVTYRWNEDDSEAFLLNEGLDEPFQIRTADGGERTQVWSYPSRSDCLSCHTAQAEYVLGVNTRQLNRTTFYPETNDRGQQLMTWNAIDLISRKSHKVKPIGLFRFFIYDRLVDPSDPRASIEDRAMSYLDSNCAQCHRPYVLRSPMDLRWGIADDERNLFDRLALTPKQDPLPCVLLARIESADPGYRMPPVGSAVPDEMATELIRTWLKKRMAQTP